MSGHERLPAATLDAIRKLTGLTGTASDILDEMGWNVTVPAATMPIRTRGRPSAVGHALTVRYLPQRAAPLKTEKRRGLSLELLNNAQPGDVLVIDASGIGFVSVFGGLAALRAAKEGLSGVVVDGGIRDVDEMDAADAIPVWSRAVTPITGKWRVELAAVNEPVVCAGVQVRAGDLVIADPTGVCFVPAEVAAAVAEGIVVLWEEEDRETRRLRDALRSR